MQKYREISNTQMMRKTNGNLITEIYITGLKKKTNWIGLKLEWRLQKKELVNLKKIHINCQI